MFFMFKVATSGASVKKVPELALDSPILDDEIMMSSISSLVVEILPSSLTNSVFLRVQFELSLMPLMVIPETVLSDG